jgi:hypothetical protein
MPQRHHRHERHDRPSGDGGRDGIDVDDELGHLTIVDAESGMLAHADREAVADAVDVDDESELAPEEAALHIERFDLEGFETDRFD